MNKKAIVLLSGGLDSILAARLMLEQGIDVLAVNFSAKLCMCGCKKAGESQAQTAAGMLGIPLQTIDITDAFVGIVKNPHYGYGANVNPCIDCKIYMLKRAKDMMEKEGASFLVTGEVLGERPMSQRRDALNIIERDAGVKGLLLRPLSAKLLEPTLSEKEGLVDRDKLLDIRGRGRKGQIALAKKFGIKEYPNPAGGCLLTDPGFARRVKDLIKHDALDINNLELLAVGRHFRLSEDVKLIIGRDEEENEILQSLIRPGDIIFRLKDREGPLSILRGGIDKELTNLAASIVAHHTKFREEDWLKIDYRQEGSCRMETISIKAANRDCVERLRI